MANAFSTVPAGGWEDGSTVTGTELRRLLLPSLVGGGTTAMGVRGGVRPARGNPLGVTLPGGMFIRAQPGVCAVPGPDTEGAYVMSNPAVLDLAVTAANATNPRIDVFGAEVVPGSPTTWRFRMLDGTAAVTPTVPTYAVAGGYFLPIAQIRTNANATVPTSVTDVRAYAVAAGGTVPIPGFAALSTAAQNALCALLPGGTGIFDPDVNVYGVVTAAGGFYRIRQAPVTYRGTDTFGSLGALVNPGGTGATTAIAFPAHEGNSYIDAEFQASVRNNGSGAQTYLPGFTLTGSGTIQVTNDVEAIRVTPGATYTAADWWLLRYRASYYSNGAAGTIAGKFVVGAGADGVYCRSLQVWATINP